MSPTEPSATPAQHDDARRDGRRPARQDRAAGRGQHDGDRAVRRARDAPHVPDHPAQGPGRFDRRRPARRSSGSTRPRASASSEAFTVINANFEQTFTTLFGGGRAGLTLLDESDHARKRHRHHRAAAGQAAAERAAAVGRREGADRDGADVRHLQVPARARSACSTKSTRRSTMRTSAGSSRCCRACRSTRSSS